MKMKISKAMLTILAALGVSACSNNNAEEQEEVKPEKIVLTNEQSEEINDKLDLIMMSLSREMGRNVTKVKSITFDEESGITLDITISDYNARKDETVDVDFVVSSTDYKESSMQAWRDAVAALSGLYAGNNVESYTNLIDKQLKTIKTASDFTYSTVSMNSLDVSSISAKLVLQKLSSRYTEEGNFDAASEIVNFLKNNPDYSATPSATWAKVENDEKTSFDYLSSLVVTANNKNYIYSFRFVGDEDETEANMVEALKAYFTNETSALKAELISINVEEVATNFVYTEETELIAAANSWLNEIENAEEKSVEENL